MICCSRRISCGGVLEVPAEPDVCAAVAWGCVSGSDESMFNSEPRLSDLSNMDLIRYCLLDLSLNEVSVRVTEKINFFDVNFSIIHAAVYICAHWCECKQAIVLPYAIHKLLDIASPSNLAREARGCGRGWNGRYHNLATSKAVVVHNPACALARITTGLLSKPEYSMAMGAFTIRSTIIRSLSIWDCSGKVEIENTEDKVWSNRHKGKEIRTKDE